MAKTPKAAEFVASLERGLRVLQTFSREHPQLTLSEVAVLTGLTPATARRSLHTLEMLGYVGRTGRRFLLRLTDDGVRTHRRLTVRTARMNQVFLAPLDADEQALFIDLIRRVADAAEELRSPAEVLR